jgi:hypothetical protein
VREYEAERIEGEERATVTRDEDEETERGVSIVALTAIAYSME